ncbi:MAG: GHMP kinase [candidate division KSB1 bacterium]|nr:GHMP kinase [candidate division KSB1 bacterium]
MIIHTKAYSRAGLAGNPSDGYFGKTLSVTLKNYYASITMYETPDLEILPNERDHSYFPNLESLVNDVNLQGYYGGIRLIKAAAKRFYDYCLQRGIHLDDRNFTVRYTTSIPVQVGLAGSSAIVTATINALMSFYGVEIPKPLIPNLILSVEIEELGISAGLQDRVTQVYEGLVYMDFDKELMEKQGYGHYENMNPKLLPPLYLAYLSDLSEISGIAHGKLRGRYEAGEDKVVNAMQYFAECAERARDCLLNKQCDQLGQIMNDNFDKRREIFPISDMNLKMIEIARSVGASAKFPGSGGAMIGTYEDENMFLKLKEKLAEIGVEVVKPQL